MPSWFGLEAHGVAFMSEWPGPEKFDNVDGVHWTDVMGYRRGGGVRYRGKANTDNWFHCAIPSLALHQHSSVTLGEIQVAFYTYGTAMVDRIHLWSADTRIKAFDGLALTGDHVSNRFTELFSPELSIAPGGINVCVHVWFGATPSDVQFVNAYARFVSPS
jgi:hypothetical protein